MRRIVSFFATIILFVEWAPMPAVASPCSGADHFETVQVLADASPVSGAQVTFYTDPYMTNVADNAQTPGIQDAIVTTGPDGTATLTLSAGQYFIRILANQYYAYTSNFVMPADGTCGTHTFSLTKAGQLDLSTEKTTVTLDPTTIVSDGAQSATLTIQAFNNVGSVMANQIVDLQTNLSGMFITHNATSTNAVGKATFTIRASVSGKAMLTPTVNGQIVKPTFLTITDALGGSTTSTAPSATRSSIVATPNVVPADGTSKVRVTITVRDANGMPVSGMAVSPRTTLAGSVYAPIAAVTDASGAAGFDLTSASSGLATITAVAGSIGLADRPTVQFGIGTGTGSSSSGTPSIVAVSLLRGKLIKLRDDGDPKTQEDTTVYYVGSDDRRHAFPDEKTYLTWYSAYTDLAIVAPDALANIPLGANVTVKPSSRLIKFPSDPKVYAVAFPHVLRWIRTPDLAVQLFGQYWSKNVNDLSEAFAPSYTFGKNIALVSDYNTAQELSGAGSIDSVLVATGSP